MRALAVDEHAVDVKLADCSVPHQVAAFFTGLGFQSTAGGFQFDMHPE